MTVLNRVLVVDDSAFMRQILTQLLSSDAELQVVGTARDGRQGVEMALSLRPDVVTLDVEMPRLDGFGTLKELMRRCPTPVVMVSSHTRAGTAATIRALTMGAVDFVAKPSGSVSPDMGRVKDELVAKVKLAARATPRFQRLLADLPGNMRQAAPGTGHRPAQRVVVIGTSTGGPGALHQVVPRLPQDLSAGVLVVQHMPPGFTRSLAHRLDEISAVPVREAVAGEPLLGGTVLVAPGGLHMVVDRDGCIELTPDPPMHGVRPAADKTLISAAECWGAGTLGILLTGMGCDGVMGLAAVRKAGGATLAEHPDTCVIYGMPKAAVEMGLADEILPIGQVADAIVRFTQRWEPLDRPRGIGGGGAL